MMKIDLFTLAVLSCSASVATAFVAQQHHQQTVAHLNHQHHRRALFMSSEETFEEEVERLVEEEMTVTKKISNLRNANGVEYAPWMKISKEEEERIRQTVKDKAAARLKRQQQEQDVQGALLVDSQAQELSGTGLRFNILNDNAVELEWATQREASTQGFLIKRRAAKTSDFEVIASYENYGPLASKGIDGGVYRYLDEDLAPGGYFYRVTECETNGAENDLSQCLVEIQTAEEQRGAVIAAVGVAVLLVGLFAAGALLDPYAV
mmetsp:Transcript_24717/g.56615  ORF Transcript_24717/g.56615 Transcript_24717/m.56615 type:complete len:264 (+) Transcript_24717:147-938(+)